MYACLISLQLVENFGLGEHLDEPSFGVSVLDATDAENLFKFRRWLSGRLRCVRVIRRREKVEDNSIAGAALHYHKVVFAELLLDFFHIGASKGQSMLQNQIADIKLELGTEDLQLHLRNFQVVTV